jgi:Tol biopolymer transport system component/tRNA A-37 threonylcarbamoyl transferase component Bud32
MTLTSGTRLGPYEVVAAIGAGGMGEVYRAKDTKLGREVAIKVLPAAFAQDPERLVRFEREARLLASLNHTNIAHIYGFESATSAEGTAVHFLAMEMVEGEDLAERLKRGAIPADEAIAIAKQIADGLEEAHEKGIVHRDLKPANLKVTPDGKVKILDFGLAKAYESEAGASAANSQLSHSPTMSRHMTEAGMIMGTAAYMSPEQARGKTVDRRADIWSFGVVLFEMLSGERLFAGETVGDTLVAVLTREPDWSRLPAEIPRPVPTLLRRCLERDPKQRLRDIGEARLALNDTASRSAPAAAESAAPSTATAPTRGPAVWAMLAVAFAAAGLLMAGWGLRRPPLPPSVTRLSIPLPSGQVLTGGSPAITRDGRRIAYVALEPGGESRLYLRALDRYESEAVQGSEGARQPFFSPDGGRVGFFARGKLLTASVSGGAPTAIADASYYSNGASWGDDDAVVFVPSLGSGLMRVPSAGGTPEQLTRPDEAGAGYAHTWPQSFASGRSVLFTTWGGANAGAAGTNVLDTQTRKSMPISPSTWSVRYSASGHLLISGPRGVMAAPYDPSRPQMTRAQTFVIDDVAYDTSSSNSWFSVSDNGTLVYAPALSNLSTFAWVDRKGGVTPIDVKAARFRDPSVSPDGARVVVEEDSAFWAVDLRRGTRTRLASENEVMNAYGGFRHDGQIVYSSNRGGDWDLYSVPAGGGEPSRLLARKGNQQYLSEAPDGTILFSDRGQATGANLWTLSRDGKAQPFLVSSASNVGGQFSPDGRVVAYVSDETGRDEIYIRPFGRPGEAVAVSTDGGHDPRWSPSGKELFYRHGDSFMAAAISTAGGLSAGDPHRLFDLRAAPGRSANHAGYDVGPDGRFLVLILDPRAIPTQLNVVLNWFEELKAKVPPR